MNLNKLQLLQRFKNIKSSKKNLKKQKKQRKRKTCQKHSFWGLRHPKSTLAIKASVTQTLSKNS